MPFKTSLWKIDNKPVMLPESKLQSEKQLENMIVQEPSILSNEWMLIGRQVHTKFSGILDLLAIAPDGSLVLIELKKGKTSREVIAQALDYATWIENLDVSDLVEIFKKFAPEENLATSFKEKFSKELIEDEVNISHEIIIVAAEIDASTERMAQYLNDRGISINVLCFQVFAHGDEQFISRTWLLDPMEIQASASVTKKGNTEPWNGEFYCSFGHGHERSWEEAREHGFICGGGGAWYSRTLKLLDVGDRVWVNIPNTGYVGVGLVTQSIQSASDFCLGDHPALDVLEANHHAQFIDDEERCEYFVAVEWLDTKALDEAIREVGMFGNQNTICRPTAQRWRHTVERLKMQFNLQG